jgi:lysophospholipase L1-like esterase
MYKQYLYKSIGVILIIFGVAFNKWTLADLFSENGRIDNNRIILLIWILNVFMVVSGICLMIFHETISKNVIFGKIIKLAKTVFIVASIAGVLYYVVDTVFGLVCPIKPWEKELNIMSAVSYINEPYYTKDFMWEQLNSSKRKYWDAPSGTRLVFKKAFAGKYINTKPLSIGSKKVYRKTVNQYDANDKTAKKILMLGGSTLYCLEVPDELTISSILAKKLNSSSKNKYFIINAGVESDASIQELERLKMELKAGLRPDIVIAYHGFNEINAKVYLNDPEVTMWEKIIRVNCKSMLYSLLNGGIFKGNIYERLRLEADKKRQVTRTVPQNMLDKSKVKEASQKSVDDFVKNNIEIYELSEKYNFKYYSILQPVAVYGEYSNKYSDINIVTAWANKNEPQIFTAFKIGYPILKSSIKQLRNSGISAYDKTDIFLNKNKNIFVDTCHVNSAGNSIVADNIAKIILNDQALPKSKFTKK